MKIALIGYGKMGKAIEKIALEKGHEIVLTISSSNKSQLTAENLAKADVCIEFSTPDAAYENLLSCLHAKVPVVCGTTAWLQHLDTIKSSTISNDTAFLYASNFSIGVNLFFKLNSYLAKLMSKHPDYVASIEEIHHTEKKDSPSGTAVSLAEGILQNHPSYNHWKNEETDEPKALPIISKRIDPAPGTHTIYYKSEIDEISINHTAHSRSGFAMGAVLAAEFLVGKKGIFTMDDVLHL